ASLNVGLNLAKGELICRHDADDWSEPNRVATLVSTFQQHPRVGMIGSDVALHRDDGALLMYKRYPQDPEEVIHRFPVANPFCHGAVCFRADCAREIGGYREIFPCSQDYDFFWRFCEKFQGMNISAPLYHYRYSESAVSLTKASDQTRCAFIIQRCAMA